MPVLLTVNNRRHELDVDPAKPLLWVLREDLGLVGAKFGCGAGLCGACTVHVAGQPMRACLMPVSSVTGPITTIEGLSSPIGLIVREAWLQLDVAQCGYCQSGQIMAATALLQATPHPSDAQIDGAMSGNLCRCGTYNRIRAAIHAVSRQAGNAS